jgi:DNA-binding HxlR family transcriptional regulator
MTSLSQRDRLLLAIVQQGKGTLSSREVDVRYSQRMSHTEESVLAALNRMAAAGLVTRVTQPGVPTDRLEITALGRDFLEDG